MFHYGDCEKKIKKYEHLMHIKDEQIVELEMQKAQLLHDIASLKQEHAESIKILGDNNARFIPRAQAWAEEVASLKMQLEQQSNNPVINKPKKQKKD